MKTLSFYLTPIILSLGLSNLSVVAAESDENSQRCNSLPFSLEGIPQTGPDPNIEYKGKLIDGITHVFYPSGRLQRRGKRIDENGNPDINGKGDGAFEIFSEEDCYLTRRDTWKYPSIHLFSEFFDKGLLTAKGKYTDNQRDGIWEYYENGTLIVKRNWKVGQLQSLESFTDGDLINRKDLYDENGINTYTEIYADGILSFGGPFRDDKQHGDWQIYDKSGTVTQIDYFEKGNKLTEEFFENEVIARRNHLKNGTYVSVEYFENGILDQKGPWWDENGNQQGVWEYYENGTLDRKATWKDGKNSKQVNIYPSITCSKLVGEFTANEMRALRDHKNKTYIISARVDSVGADMFDEPEITLSDGDQWSFNSCMAKPAEGEDFFYDLDKDQLVEMECVVTGEVMGSPVLEGCVLVN